jgi:LuxR family maltose regulon positive regulatory protein
LGGDVRSLIAGNLLGARLKMAEGDLDGAAHELERARPLLDGAHFPEWRCRFNRCQLELWLAQDRLRSVVRWADSLGTDALADTRDELLLDRLTLARALIVKGQQPDRERALSILRQAIESALAHGRMGMQIEALALQALALWAEGDRPSALISLERSLRLAEPERYVRLFADLGLPMFHLLQEAHARKVMPDYVARLRDAFGGDLALALALAGSANGAALPEPLSAREVEVLRLLAAGLTNREAAAALFISPETVKKHSGGIYGKLGVSNRTEAAARARELGLLD